MIITLCNTRPSPAAVGHLSRSPLKLSSSPLAVTGWEQVLTSPHQPRQLGALQPRPSHQLLSLVVAGHCRGGRLELSRWFILLQRVLWIINNQHCGVYDDTSEKGLEVVILYYYWLHRQHWAMSHGGSAHARHNSSALPCHMCCAVLPCLLPGCCSSLL